MNIVLIGPPGSGKGTQAARLQQAYGLQHISTGEIFRSEIAKASPLGQRVQSFVTKGGLVPDELVVEVVAARLEDVKASFLMDGFPRTEDQALSFDGILKKWGRTIDKVVYLVLPEAEVLKRLGGRWTCPNCAEIYNAASKPPKAAGVCDKDGGKLFQREDDKPEAIKKRLAVYENQTKPLVAYYRKTGKLVEISAAASPDAVFGEIQKALGAAAGAAN